jgi:hypothetical protein
LLSIAQYSEVVVLDVLLEVGESLRLLTVLLDGAGGSTSDLSGDTGLVVLALSEPFAEFLSGVDLDERDLVLLGEGGDDLLVLGVVAVSGEHAEVSLLGVKSLSDLVESLNEACIKSV